MWEGSHLWCLGGGTGSQAWPLSHPDLVMWKDLAAGPLIIPAVTGQKPGRSQLGKSREAQRGRLEGRLPSDTPRGKQPVAPCHPSRAAEGQPPAPFGLGARTCASACCCWKLPRVIAQNL